jgi:hypothetical protein
MVPKVAQLRDAIKRVNLNTCEVIEGKDTFQCKVILTVEANGKKEDKVITPTFKKRFDEWQVVGGIFD